MKRLLIISIFILCLACLCSCSLFNKPCEHSEVVDAAVAPTCTESGLTEGKHCSTCGEVIVAQQSVAPLGHTEALDEAKAATCTEDGLTTGVHCSVCQATIIAQKIIPAEHTYGDWEHLSESTCLIPGEKKRICSVCDYVNIEKLELLDHSFVKSEESGLFSCEKCEAVIFAGHLYATLETEINWYDAYKLCNDMGGYLVTVTSEREQQLINSIIASRTLPEGRSEYTYWSGLMKKTNVWEWVNGEELDFTYWGPQGLDGNTANWHMAFTTKLKNQSANSSMLEGHWEDVRHTELNGIICEIDLNITESTHYFTEWETITEVSCYGDGEEYRLCTHCGLEETRVINQYEHNFVLDEVSGVNLCEHCSAALYNGRIYKAFDIRCSWYDAHIHSTKLGGHLLTIASQEEQDFVESYMTAISFTDEAWIGAFNDGIKWQWSHKENFGYTHWDTNQPDKYGGYQFFATINYTNFGRWHDRSPLEGNGYLFICEWETDYANDNDKYVDLEGLNLSIIGDSISTYSGVNNDKNANSTIGSNSVYYPKGEINSADETWWKQTAAYTGMNVLVNNSWSGSRVLNGNGAAYLDRCVQLHDDAGDNAGTNPDVIAVYMGVNDYNVGTACGSFNTLSDIYTSKFGYVTPTTFAEAYAIMIHKMVNKYGKAEVFVLTIPPYSGSTNVELLDSYNAEIRKIAAYFDCHVVDLAAIEGYDYAPITIDGIHPNEAGMDIISELFASELEKVFNPDNAS